MIQIYGKDNTDYSRNGDMVLMPESCELSAELNGTWQMGLSHPLDDEGRWKYIEEEAVISAPTFIGDRQLFRIEEIKKTDDGITAAAYPVFYDSADDCFLSDIRPTGKTGQEALDLMTAGSPYSGESDIKTESTAYFVRRNLMEAISGDEEPTFLTRWGGEILYDNYKVIINSRIGEDYGAEARYGKNITGIEYSVDMSEVATRLVPLSYNGHTIGGTDGYVDSPNIDKYAKKYIRTVAFDDVKLAEDASDDEDENITVCADQAALDKALKEKCEKLFADGADLPSVSMSIDMALLSLTDEYRDYEELEKVSLGDTVRCFHSRLGISSPARVISLTWDCVRNKPEKIVLGDYVFDYFRKSASDAAELGNAVSGIDSALNGITDGSGNVRAGKVAGVLDAMKTQLRYQKDVSKKQDVRAILFEDLDPASPTYGAMCLGTKGFEIAGARTADGRDWNWSTFGTSKGFNADLITAGTMVGEHIHGGTISVGGAGNEVGKIAVLDDKGGTVVNIDRRGITLSGGASLLSSNGVCGNLQFVSNGGEFKALGGSSYWTGGAMSIFFTASIPENYVITDAKMTLIAATAYGPGNDTSQDVIGYSRGIKLYTAPNIEFIFGYEEFNITGDNWEQIVSGGFTAAGPSGTGTDVPKIIRSGNISSKLKKGLNLFKIDSTLTNASDMASSTKYTGVGLAILDIIGYSKGA